jgi:uncharacterized protein (DUF4415 family)
MTASRRVLGGNLNTIDTHILGPDNYAEIPELTDPWFDKSLAHRDVEPLRRGRPKAASTKQQVTLRLDRDVLDRFRETGEGWQSRINEALRKAAGV